MNHNLFTHPSECTILINDNGYEIENFTESDNVLNILEDIGYDASKLLTNLKINSHRVILGQKKKKVIHFKT